MSTVLVTFAAAPLTVGCLACIARLARWLRAGDRFARSPGQRIPLAEFEDPVYERLYGERTGRVERRVIPNGDRASHAAWKGIAARSGGPVRR